VKHGAGVPVPVDLPHVFERSICGIPVCNHQHYTTEVPRNHSLFFLWLEFDALMSSINDMWKVMTMMSVTRIAAAA
jgi:hypothetical protein